MLIKKKEVIYVKRTREEVEMRCSFILGDKKVLYLVSKSSSPTAAYDMIFSKTQDVKKAKAGRWLAILRRDHEVEYQKLVR